MPLHKAFTQVCGAVALAAACVQPAAQAQTLTVFAAGTLGKTFTTLAHDFEKLHPGVTVQPQFGGSIKMVRQVTVLHQPADVVAVADDTIIPRDMFVGSDGARPTADWSIRFLGNAITFVYTARSKGAQRIDAHNWWQVLSAPGVQIGRSNPDTDPSGYQTLQMLELASRYYRQPDLAARVLANSPRSNVRDTETDLISALQLGQIDYLAIYRSDAVQHHLLALDLPPQINLGDPRFAADYARATVRTRQGEVSGRPIVYALTIPTTAPHPELAQQFVAYLLGPAGQKVFAANGFITLRHPVALHRDKLPASLRRLTVPAAP